MQGYELVKKVETEKREHPDRMFIKWWRNEEDFVDFDLVSRFLDSYSFSSEIAGFELIGMDEMWETVLRRSKGKASKVRANGGWMVHWTPPKGAEDVERRSEHPYTPETLLMVLDVETGDNYVD